MQDSTPGLHSTGGNGPSWLLALAGLQATVHEPAEGEMALGRIDPVTMRPNRVSFLDDRSRSAVPTGDQAPLLVLVTLADAKHFNEILRALGHSFAEDLVRAGAAVLDSIVPPGTRVYHVSVLSFAFVLEGEAARGRPPAVVAALRCAFAKPLMCQRIPVDTRVGIGLTLVVGDRDAVAEALRAALNAAQASRQAAAGWSFYDPAADAAHRRAFRLLQDLPRAIAAPDQLTLVFQPRIDLRSGRCHGAEALLRWCHPELGPISPGEFIPLAEATAVIGPLTDWVVDAGIRQLAALTASGHDIDLSLNVSPQNFRDDGFATRVLTGLDRHGVAATRLELELTEGSLAADTGPERRQLQRLIDAGCRLAIDDFGSGYSNMAYLTWLPANILKIDQSLIRTLVTENGDVPAASLHLVRSIISLAKGLGFRIVGEGIENAQVQERLLTIDCDEGQGFGISRPLHAAALIQWLDAQRAIVADDTAEPRREG